MDAARNGRGTESKTKYSYSGVRAKTANRSALQKAIEMRNQNKSNEEIRKETGWFVGMDGKWRFEINDRDMEFSADGTLRTQSADGIKTLADFISHEKLFAAYPDLADVPVYFTDIKNGNFGFYSPGMDEIALNRELLSDREELLGTLMHEIQHAIQKREKFTPGASKAYWNRCMEEGFDTRTAKEKREGERLQKEYDDLKASDPEFAADMEELNAMTPTVSRGAINWDTLEQVEPDPPEWEAFDRKRDLLEEKYGDRVFDWFALRDQIDMNRNKQSRMPGELYHDTAGEIEARDSSARRTLTEEERRKKAPDLGDENTVFADNTVAFYAKDAMGSKTASVKEQLKESRDTLNRLPPVTSKTVLEDIEKLSAAQRYEWAIRELKASGYRVERVDGSVITFEPKDINSGLRYLNTAGEIAAYTALPAVLKRGIVIHENPNHKGRGYGTVTYAAPVEINGVRGNMAVVVRQTNGNRYDVHRIVMPDGAAFEFKKKANAVPTSAGGITDIAKASGEVDPAINTASKRSIRQTTENSQEKSSDEVQNQQRDYSYEALTSKPDMQVTMVDDTANYAAGSEARKNVITKAIAAAKKIGSTNENGNAVIHVDDMDTDVILSARGLRHGLDRRFSVNAPVTLKAGEILKNAVRINELTPKKDTIDASYVLIGAAKNVKNEPYIVQFVVNRASNEVTSVDVLHSIGAKTEPAGSLSPEVTGVPATLTGSAISISSLLDYVNRYFPDVLPESVLKHYGHDARPAGELGTNALFQQRELRLSDRAVLLWAAEKAVSERSKRWSTEDLNRFDLLVKKLKRLDDACAELEALKRYKNRQQTNFSSAACFCKKSDVALGVHIEHAAGGDAQSGDDGQRHEAQGHERVDVAGHAQTERLVLGALQRAVDHDQWVVAHDARDGQRHLAQHLAIFHDGDAAVVLHDAVGGGGHLLLAGAHDDDVVGVVGDAGGHGAGLQAVALDIAQADVVGVLMPLDDGHLEDIVLHVDVVDIAGVLGDDLPGHQTDDGVGTAVLEIVRCQLAEVEGVMGAVDQIGVDLRRGEVTKLAVIHQLAPLIDHFNIEILEIINDNEVGQIPGGDGAAVIEQEVAGGGVAGGLYGDDGVNAQRNGLFHDVVDMTLLQQVIGVLVVGAEHAAIHILAAQQGDKCLQIAGGGALADHDELAALQLGQSVIQIGALVVGVHAGGYVGVEVVAAEAGGVAIDLLVVRLRGDDLFHYLRVAVDGAHKVHHFGKTLYAGVVIEGVDGAVIQHGAGLIQGRGGHAGGQHEAHIHRQILRGLEHVLDAVGAHDVGDLMGVGDDGGGAVGEDGFGKLRGADQRTFQMDMGIQKAGQHELAADIYLHMAVVLAHAYDKPLGNGDVAVPQLIGEDIDIGGVFQHQIGGDTAGGHVDDMEFFVELAVDLAGIAFFHGHKIVLLSYRQTGGGRLSGGICFINSSYYHSLSRLSIKK